MLHHLALKCNPADELRCRPHGRVPVLPLDVPPSELAIRPIWYKGFAITARTYQIRGSGLWTLGVLIAGRGRLRSFTGPATYESEAAAVAGCGDFAREIIDGKVADCRIEDR